MLLAGLLLIGLYGLVLLSVLPVLADECHPTWYLDDDGQDATPNYQGIPMLAAALLLIALGMAAATPNLVVGAAVIVGAGMLARSERR